MSTCPLKWTKNQLVRKQNLLISYRHIFTIHSPASLTTFFLLSMFFAFFFCVSVIALWLQRNWSKQYHVQQSGGEPKTTLIKRGNPNRTSKEHRNVRIPTGSRRIYLAGKTTSGPVPELDGKITETFYTHEDKYIFARKVYLILDVDFNIIF